MSPPLDQDNRPRLVLWRNQNGVMYMHYEDIWMLLFGVFIMMVYFWADQRSTSTYDSGTSSLPTSPRSTIHCPNPFMSMVIEEAIDKLDEFCWRQWSKEFRALERAVDHRLTCYAESKKYWDRLPKDAGRSQGQVNQSASDFVNQ